MPLPTIGISSTTCRPDTRLTVATAYLTREITRPGLNRKANGSHKKKTGAGAPAYPCQRAGWIRQSPRARQAKSKARITAYESLLAEAKEKSPDTAQIIVPVGPRLGDLVIEASSLAKGFEDKLLIEDLSFKLPPGGIVGVIGPNGSGKTTLFRMISGRGLTEKYPVGVPCRLDM